MLRELFFSSMKITFPRYSVAFNLNIFCIFLFYYEVDFIEFFFWYGNDNFRFGNFWIDSDGLEKSIKF
jgi:hypothetical protein